MPYFERFRYDGDKSNLATLLSTDGLQVTSEIGGLYVNGDNIGHFFEGNVVAISNWWNRRLSDTVVQVIDQANQCLYSIQ